MIKIKILFLIAALNFVASNNAISKNIFTKCSAAIGAISCCYLTRATIVNDFALDYRDWYSIGFKKGLKTELLIYGLSVLSGYGIGSLFGNFVWSFCPKGKIEKAKNIVSSVSRNKTFEKIQYYRDGQEFRDYIKEVNIQYSMPLITEFFFYINLISELEKAEDLLNFNSEKLNKEKIKLLEEISNKRLLLNKAIKMLKEDQNWLEMLNSYNIEKNKEYQEKLCREVQSLKYMPTPVFVLN